MDERDPEDRRVAVVGGGVAGLTAGTFTARAGFDTVVLEHDESILRRNAHLENVPGFPAGVNARLFLDLLEAQAGRNGCLFDAGRVTTLRPPTDGERFVLERDDEPALRADYVLVASWPDASYLEAIPDVGLTSRGSKTYVAVDDDGRSGQADLYAAGRIAGTAHQTVVCAGDGAAVALSLIADSPVPYYHDWVAPEGYFTDRGRDVPPGCEEIDADERRRRERESIERMQAAFADHHPAEPTMHPSVRDSAEEE